MMKTFSLIQNIIIMIIVMSTLFFCDCKPVYKDDLFNDNDVLLPWSGLTNTGIVNLLAYLGRKSFIRSLDLSNNSFGLEGIKVLAGFLSRADLILLELKLTSNNISYEGSKILGEALKECKSLRKLDLSFNKLGAEGGAAVLTSLVSHPALKELDISYCNIGNEGAKYISELLENNLILEELILNSNNFDDDIGIHYLSQGIRNNMFLKALYFGPGNNVISESNAIFFGEALSKNSALQILDLSTSTLTSNGMKSLFAGFGENNHYQLEVLSFNEQDMRFGVLEALAGGLTYNNHLRELHLASGKIDVSSAKFVNKIISQHPTLKLLDLSYNRLMANGIKVITSTAVTAEYPTSGVASRTAAITVANLEYLDLSGNELYAESMPFICKMLEGTSNISTLLLGQNNIGDDGVMTLADCLHYNSHLITLHLNLYNKISDDGAIALAKLIRSNTSNLREISLSGNPISKRGGVALIKSLRLNKKLVFLDLSGTNIPSSILHDINALIERNTIISIQSTDPRTNLGSDRGRSSKNNILLGKENEETEEEL